MPSHTHPRVGIFLLLLLMAAGLTHETAPSPPARPSLTPALRARLDRFMLATLKTSHAPGMILAIWLPGNGEFIRAKGVANTATGTPMRVSDTFRIGSLTKTFTSTAILQLVDAGKLRLDARINSYTRATLSTSLIPAIPGGMHITIRMLLNHTSGLYNYSEIPDIAASINTRFHTFTPQQLVTAAVKEKPYFAPGKGFKYSNTNTIILGMLIEQLTSRSLENEIMARFIVPLHLRHTAFPTTSVFIPGLYSHGYYQDNPHAPLLDWTEQSTTWAWAAGGMTSNISDLHLWLNALTGSGLLSPALQHQRLTSWVPASLSAQPSTAKYGMNIFTLGGFVGHNGALPGFVCMAVRQPRTGDTIVFMLNAQTPTGDTLKILEQLLPLLYPGLAL